MPLNSFIHAINDHLRNQFPKDAAFFGVCQSIPRIQGSVEEVLPGQVNQTTGEIKYVGVDDRNSLVAYHKLNGITVEPVNTRGGFGDEPSDTRNTYSLSMLVYHDMKKTGDTSDLFLHLQNTFPQFMNAPPYKSVLLRITSVILNSGQLFAQEYKGTSFKLPATSVLFQLNYTIESSFKRGCFEKLCPEDIH